MTRVIGACAVVLLGIAACDTNVPSDPQPSAAGAPAVEALTPAFCSAAQNDNWFHAQFPTPPEGNWQVAQTAQNPPTVPTAILYSGPGVPTQSWRYYGSNYGHPACDHDQCDYTLLYVHCLGNCDSPVKRLELHCWCYHGSNGGECDVTQTY